MVKNASQPPYTPEQARARARAAPSSGGTGKSVGRVMRGPGAADKAFKPGKRTGSKNYKGRG